MPTKPLGAVIRRLREEKGLTSTQLAHAAGLDPAHAWKIEHETIAGSPASRKRIADVLGVPVADICTYVPPKSVAKQAA